MRFHSKHSSKVLAARNRYTEHPECYGGCEWGPALPTRQFSMHSLRQFQGYSGASRLLNMYLRGLVTSASCGPYSQCDSNSPTESTMFITHPSELIEVKGLLGRHRGQQHITLSRGLSIYKDPRSHNTSMWGFRNRNVFPKSPHMRLKETGMSSGSLGRSQSGPKTSCLPP